MLTDVIIILVVLLIAGGAGFYVWKARKSGKRCVGCPEGGSCSGSCGGCNCGSKDA